MTVNEPQFVSKTTFVSRAELLGGLLLAAVGLRIGLRDLDAAALLLRLGLRGLRLRLGRRGRAAVAAVVGVVVVAAPGDAEREQHQEKRQVPQHGAEA